MKNTLYTVILSQNWSEEQTQMHNSTQVRKITYLLMLAWYKITGKYKSKKQVKVQNTRESTQRHIGGQSRRETGTQKTDSLAKVQNC